MLKKIKLKIADTIIQMQICFSLDLFFNKGKQGIEVNKGLKNFVYKGKKKSDILIDVEIVNKLPGIYADTLFIANHFETGDENWRLLKKGNSYIYKNSFWTNRQLMWINKTFDSVTGYLLYEEYLDKMWDLSDNISNFLQFLLINHFALKKKGIVTHAAGIKDLNGKGLIFAGKSGCGKTTTAKLWSKHTKAMVLNDDRIVVRKFNDKFIIHGSPWHGDFSDYLDSKLDSTYLEKLFFIYHAPENTVKRITPKEAFSLFYTAIFPAFWNKSSMEYIVSFLEDLVKNVSCYSLGFVNNKKMIGFVRSIK